MAAVGPLPGDAAHAFVSAAQRPEGVRGLWVRGGAHVRRHGEGGNARQGILLSPLPTKDTGKASKLILIPTYEISYVNMIKSVTTRKKSLFFVK